MAISLIDVIKTGDQETAKKILRQHRCSNLDKQSSRKDGTALFWSCCQGFLDVVNLLLLQGADVNLSTGWGATPVHASVDNNQVEILSLLIDFGANVNKQTKNGDTPSHLAAYRGYGRCVQLLAEQGANVLIKNNKRKTPLQEAESGGHLEVARYLQAVQNLSLGTSLEEKSMSIPLTSVRTVTSSLTDFGSYPSSNFPSTNYLRSPEVTDASCQTQYGTSLNSFNASPSIPNSIHESKSGMHSNSVMSSDTSRLLYQPDTGLYPSYEQSYFPSFTSSSPSSMSSSSLDLSLDYTKRDIVGVLRLCSPNKKQKSYMNDLSSMESSHVASSDSTKPSLTFKNI